MTTTQPATSTAMTVSKAAVSALVSSQGRTTIADTVLDIAVHDVHPGDETDTTTASGEADASTFTLAQ